MKKLIVMLLAIMMVAVPVFAGGASEGGSSETINLVLSEVHAEGYPTTLADYEFARLVNERSNGRINIQVYSGGTLYGEETGSIEALQIGDLAFARVSASPVASYVPALNVIQLPYLYRDADHMWAVLNGEIGQQMLADIQTSGSGLVGLAYYDAGARNFYTVKPVRSLEDMKGLKIRLQNNAMMVEMAELLGANGVTGIGPNDVYSAIQQGTIDGQENPHTINRDQKFWEVQKYITESHYLLWVGPILVSEKWYRKLDPQTKELVNKAAKQAQAVEWAWADEQDAIALQDCLDHGMVLNKLTDEPVWMEAARSVWPQFYDKVGGKALVDEALAIMSAN